MTKDDSNVTAALAQEEIAIAALRDPQVTAEERETLGRAVRVARALRKHPSVMGVKP